MLSRFSNLLRQVSPLLGNKRFDPRIKELRDDAREGGAAEGLEVSVLVTERQFSTEISSLSVSGDRWRSAESLSILELYLKKLLINYFAYCYAISVRVCLVLAKLA